jgi:adenylate cyclase
MSQDRSLEELWRGIITGENPAWRKRWKLRRMIPSKHRCKNCNAPFTGLGGMVMRLVDRGPYNRNPRFCNF